jgi:tripartite-type tricarboxylate transporter receptor subunit TctC
MALLYDALRLKLISRRSANVKFGHMAWLLLGVPAAVPADAQTIGFPSKPVRIIVPLAPGGAVR